ncbi:MAG TPA: APC family permease [Candidatus Hydrogenedentes bacterium]|nr:APC family permease [Candidatus Hydrogenedentota bacterium]
MSANASGPQLERTIGLVGAVALVIGGVIGAGIYALIGSIGAKAGYATWLAFLIAMFASIAGAIPVIQVASSMPRAGAGYLFTSRLLFPLAGTVSSGLILLAGASSTALTIVALTTYLPPSLTFGVPLHLVGIGILIVFYLIMLCGLQLAMGLQVIMVAQMLVALGIYALAGLYHTPLEFSTVPRQGAGQFFMAVVLCYNACMGFQVLAEMGEEIHHPKRTIPLALLIGGVVVTLIYISVGMVLVNSLPYTAENYDPDNAPINASALLFLPASVVAFINFGSLTAGLTSLNAAAVALPRELFAQSRDGILPAALSRVGARSHAPLAATSTFFGLLIFMVFLNMDQDFYGLTAALGIQMITSAMCIASLRLPRKYPKLYREAYVVFPVWLLWLCTIASILTTILFGVIVAMERSSVVVVYATLAVALAIYHLVRVAHLRRNAFPYDARVQAIPGSDDPEDQIDVPH